MPDPIKRGRGRPREPDAKRARVAFRMQQKYRDTLVAYCLRRGYVDEDGQADMTRGITEILRSL